MTQQTLCSDCGAATSNVIGQRADGLKLRWYCSIRCPHCGMALETDDYGIPPDEIRREIIRSEGRWGLKVEIERSQRLSLCKILHGDLKTTLEEVKQMKQRMPGIVYTGTKTEMKWLHGRLREFGFESLVVEQSDNQHTQSIDIAQIQTLPS